MESIPNDEIVAENHKNRHIWSEKDQDAWRIELLRRINHNLFQKGDLSDVEWTIIGCSFLGTGINLKTLLHPDIQKHISEILIYD